MSQSLSLSQKLDRAVARFFMGRSHGVLRAIAGGKPVVREGLTLHPEMQLILWAGRQRPHQFRLRDENVAIARKRMRAATALYDHPLIEVGKVQDLQIDGGAGPLRARHYAPGQRARPRTSARVLPRRRLRARRSRHARRAVPAAVPRRRACTCSRSTIASRPSTRSPPRSTTRSPRSAGRQQHAAELGADPTRARRRRRQRGRQPRGGRRARSPRRADRPPLAQLLLYPATDSQRTTTRRSRRSRDGLLPRRRATCDWFDAMYLAEVGRTPHRPAALAAARPRTCRGLPPRWSSRPASTRCATRARRTPRSSRRAGVHGRAPPRGRAQSTASSTWSASAASRARP